MKKAMGLILTLGLLLSTNIWSKECNLNKGLSKKQLKTLKRAKKIKRVGPNATLLGKNVYQVDILSNSDESRFLILLGEAHIKGPRSSYLGSKVVKEFPLRLLEGIPKKESLYIAENLQQLNDSLGWQRIAARVITFNFFGSTITHAQKKGVSFYPGYSLYTLNKKEFKLNAPTETAQDIIDLFQQLGKEFKQYKKGVNLPLEVGRFETPSTNSDYILVKRNERMVDSLMEYQSANLLQKTNLIIVGSAHNKGMIELLGREDFLKCDNF